MEKSSFRLLVFFILTITFLITPAQVAQAQVKPEVFKVRIPIEGSLYPGLSHRRGPYSSCLYIHVSVTWSPSDQGLGIGYTDVETGEGRIWWCTGGSASRGFSTDWTRSYYVWISSWPGNTEVIDYEGTITLTMW